MKISNDFGIIRINVFCHAWRYLYISIETSLK